MSAIPRPSGDRHAETASRPSELPSFDELRTSSSSTRSSRATPRTRRRRMLPVLSTCCRRQYAAGCRPRGVDRRGRRVPRGAEDPHVEGVITFYTMYREPPSRRKSARHHGDGLQDPALPAARRGGRPRDALEQTSTASTWARRPPTAASPSKRPSASACATWPRAVLVDEAHALRPARDPRERESEMPRWRKPQLMAEQTHRLPEHAPLDRRASDAGAVQGRQAGGYEGLEKALEMEPDRGHCRRCSRRACAAAAARASPPAASGAFVPKDTGKPTTWRCNADESEPGCFKDRQILERDPHLLIEGCLIAPATRSARHDGLHLHPRRVPLRDRARMEEAPRGGPRGRAGRQERSSAGWNCDDLGPPGRGRLHLRRGDGLLSSLEGGRGYPKIKPPFPAVEGAFALPDDHQQRRDPRPRAARSSRDGGRRSSPTRPAARPGQPRAPGTWSASRATSRTRRLWEVDPASRP